MDGGQVLQDLYPERRGMDPVAVRTMLRSYAQLQRATVGHRERLRAAGLPDRSLLAFEHNDLFPRNVFVPRADRGYRFFDFGESLWSHPFESLAMLAWEVVHQHKLPAGETGASGLGPPRHP